MDRSELLTLVFTDLVGSTALKRERGDREAGLLIARHRQSIVSLVNDDCARVVDWAGDGCFLTFDAPSNALLFALSLQDVHARESDLPRVRIGVHLGEVSVTETGVEGLAVDLAARVCSLALPGQILLSRHAFDNARQRVRSHGSGQPISWRAHGTYFLKGSEDAVEICEAGHEGTAPLASPPDSEKARRGVTQAEEDTLGWRPAAGLTVPGRQHWVLEAPLGQGGFGEVWLARHEKIHAHRVFKFCFEPERIRGLRREVVLLRLLQESLGARPDIAKVLDWEFDSAPYFIESEYTEGGDLQTWANREGGLVAIPMQTRLELIAQVADALGAAHSAGVLHKDIKPSNVLVDIESEAQPRICLTDFGIGLVTDRDLLQRKGITSAGLTDTLLASSSPGSGSGSGTHMYMAPELIEGKPASTKSDVYALGVLLYQATCGDFSHSLAPGWERDVADDVLREDIANCIDGDPERRLANAADLAARLRAIPQRRKARADEENLKKKNRTRRRILAFSVPAAAISILVTLAITVFAERWEGLFREAEVARNESDRLRSEAEYHTYVANVKLAAMLLEAKNLTHAREVLLKTKPEFRGWEWGYWALRVWPDKGAVPAPADGRTSAAALWRGATAQLFRLVSAHTVPVVALDFSPDGSLLATYGQDGGLNVSRWVEGETLWRRQTHSTGNGFVRFSHDGKTLAFSDDGDVAFYDLAIGKEIARERKHVDAIESGLFSADDRLFVIASADGAIRASEIASGKPIWTLDPGQTPAEPDSVTRRSKLLGLNRDGTQVLLVDGLGGIQNVGVSTGTVLGKSSLRYPAGLDPVCLGQNAESLIAYDATAMCHLVLDMADAKSKGIVSHFVSAGPFTRNAVVSRDGSICFLRNGLGGIVPLDLEFSDVPVTNSSALVRGLTNFPGMDGLAVSPNGSFLAAPQADGSVVVYSAARTSDPAPGMNQSAPVYIARFDPVHRRIVTADRGGGLVAWDLDRRTMLRRWTGHADGIIGLEASPDFDRWLTHSYDGHDALWSTDLTEPISTFENGIPKLLAGGANGPIVRLGASVFTAHRFSPDGRRILVAKGAGEVDVLDAATLQLAFSLPGHQTFAFHVTYSPKGTMIVTHAFDEPVVTVWDAKTGREMFSLRADTPIVSFAISPGETTLAATTRSPAILRWSLADGKELTHIATAARAWDGIVFSPTGRYFVTAAPSGAAAVWHTKTTECVAEFTGHHGNVLAARFNPRGDRVLTLGLDKTLRVWDLQGNQLALFEFTENLYFADWSPDGDQIVVASHDGSIRFLDSAPQLALPE